MLVIGIDERPVNVKDGNGGFCHARPLPAIPVPNRTISATATTECELSATSSRSSLAEVASRLDVLAGTLRWRTAEGGKLGHIVVGADRLRPPAADRPAGT
jgi:hypothetical protein